MADDRIPENWASDNDTASSLKEDDEQEMTPGPPGMSSRHGLPTSTMMPAQPSAEHSPTSHMSAGPYLTEMPVRGGSYQQQLMGGELHQEQSHFVEAAPMTTQSASMHGPNALPLHDMFPSPHDTSRRPSMFPPPAEYASPATPAVYPGGWQSTTAAPSSSPMYSYPPQQPGPQQAFVGQHGVPMPHGQQFMASSNFDGLTRTNHDPSHGSMYRPTNLGHNPGQQTSVYSGYSTSNVKMEAARNSIV
jgi:hypothetical protein